MVGTKCMAVMRSARDGCVSLPRHRKRAAARTQAAAGTAAPIARVAAPNVELRCDRQQRVSPFRPSSLDSTSETRPSNVGVDHALRLPVVPLVSSGSIVIRRAEAVRNRRIAGSISASKDSAQSGPLPIQT